MDEAERVLSRLERIKELNDCDAPTGVLLDELRELVAEAEEWARAEGDTRARSAAAALGERLSQAGEVAPLALVTE
jgi:hypothetical protein